MVIRGDAAQGVFEFFKAKGHALSPVGLQIMVHGTVPQGERSLSSVHAPAP